MNRLVMIGGLVVVAGLAVAVYRAKLGAEETQSRIDGLKGEVAKTEKDIAVMRAEEAYLTRPERIGPLARDRLGLEPASPDSFFRWGFFLEVLERTEYVEDYVMEPMAQRMLDADPALRAAFEQRLHDDSEFAADPRQRLEWFYRRTPFFDQRWRLYPVGLEP